MAEVGPGPLAGRVALVTGAGGGLGAAVAERFRHDGADVVGVDLVGEDVVRADIGTAEGNQRAVAAALERHGRLDVLVLNAGVQHTAPISEFPLAEWDRLNDVMVKGVFLGLQAAWEPLTARPGGQVVITASTSSFVAEPNKVAYVAAKHAVLGIVKVAALEGAAAGLSVNAVAPGWMRTPLAERQVEQRVAAGASESEALDGLLGGQPVRRFVELDDVAQVMSFLASGRATSVTGTCVPVDLAALAV